MVAISCTHNTVRCIVYLHHEIVLPGKFTYFLKFLWISM